MKKTVFLAALLVLAVVVATRAQTTTKTTTTTTTTTTTQSIANSMSVFVFPAAGQSASTQTADEANCYQWAIKQTGIDPFQLQKQSAQAQQAIASSSTAPQTGSGVGGAARGAAAGALFGAIGGSAGTGAAVGAAAGFVGGRARNRAANQQAQQQAAAGQAQFTQEQMNTFKNAFSVCLEGKKYTVRF